jgi:hypothetical protein
MFSAMSSSFHYLILGKTDLLMAQDSSVGISTGYGLDGRGSIPGKAKFILSP